MDRADKGTMTKRTVHHFLKKYTLKVMQTSPLEECQILRLIVFCNV